MEAIERMYRNQPKNVTPIQAKEEIGNKDA